LTGQEQELHWVNQDVEYPGQGDSLLTQLSVSRPNGSESVLYWRQGITLNHRWEYIRNYARYLTVLDLGTGEKQPTLCIDTVRVEELDLSDLVLAREGATIDIVRRDLATDNLFAERYKVTNGAIVRYPVVEGVRVYHVFKPDSGSVPARREPLNARADYSLRLLPDGRRLVVWSGTSAASDYEIFAAVFDASWQLVGAIKRVNLDSTGQQIFPAIEIQGQRVYVTWQDTRHDVIEVYLRTFDIDHLTAVLESSSAENRVSIVEAWPQPATSELHIAVHSPTQTKALQITVFDLMGRVVLSRQSPVGGAWLQTLDVNDWRPGIYTLLISSGTYCASRTFLVTR
jgi:hypothetical protein